MTIDEVITVLNDKDVSIRWDGMCYSLRLRNIPRGFFADYQRIDSLHTAGILDDEAAQKAKAALVEKYGTVEEQSILAANSHEKGGTVSNGAKIL